MFGSPPLPPLPKVRAQRPLLVLVGSLVTVATRPEEGPGGGVEGVDLARLLVADQQVAAELAEADGGQGHAPGVLERRRRAVAR